MTNDQAHKLVRSCLGKKRMRESHADKIIAKSNFMRKYYCMECYGWHLTSRTIK